MDDFTLQIDRPGFGVSFALNPKVLATKIANEETIELNVRQLFRRLTGRKKSIQLSTVNTQSSPSIYKSVKNSSDMPEQQRSLFKSSNTFDSIIDKLERKYYHAAHIDDAEENSTTSDGTESQLHSPDAEQSEKKKKKRKLISDDYDYSDPFIDDAEEVQEYEGAIAAKRKKSQKKGYYVSSGDVQPAEFTEVVFKQDSDESKSLSSEQRKLEGSKLASSVINKEKKMSENILKQKSAATKAKSSKTQSSTQNTATTSSSEERIVSNFNSSSALVSQIEVPISENITSLLENESGVKLAISTTPTGSDGQLNSSVINETDHLPVEQKKTRVSVPKPLWVPHESAVIAMDLFKSEVEKYGPSTLKKTSPFPAALEQPLLELHTEVMKVHDLKELTKTAGYYEFISSCLGTQFPAGRVKTNLLRLLSKENCRKIYMRVTMLMDSFKNDLKKAIVPCPEDKKFQNKDTKSKDKKDTGIASAGEEMDVDADPSAGLSQFEESAIVSSRTEIPVDTMCTPQPNEDKKVYVWFCKFSLQLRQRLVELLDLVAEWVKAENEYRSKLVLADKKDMLPEEYAELDSAVEVEKVIDSISTIFPDDCLEGDKNAIKKAIKTERARIRRAISATNASAKSSTVSAPVVATIGVTYTHATILPTAMEVQSYF